MATITAQGTAVQVPCPACGMPVLLHLGPGTPQPGGYLTYDATMAHWGMTMHLRNCEVA